MRNHIPVMATSQPSICVFCGASFGNDPVFAEEARRLGAGLAARGFRMVFGGGNPGLMGVTACAARDAGAPVTGILPGFLRDLEPPLNEGETTEIVPDLFVRKQIMIEQSDGFVVLPGGLGTYDEFFEVLTGAQLGVHAKPILLVNVKGYFDNLEALLHDAVRHGFVREANLSLYRMVPDAQAALDALAELFQNSR